MVGHVVECISRSMSSGSHHVMLKVVVYFTYILSIVGELCPIVPNHACVDDASNPSRSKHRRLARPSNVKRVCMLPAHPDHVNITSRERHTLKSKS